MASCLKSIGFFFLSLSLLFTQDSVHYKQQFPRLRLLPSSLEEAWGKAADAIVIQRAWNALKRLWDKRCPPEDHSYYSDERKGTCLQAFKFK